jgi:hypothetical protein
MHASFQGIGLTTSGPDKMAHVGPFFDEKKLRVWLSEIAIRLSHAAMILVSSESHDLKLLAAQIHFLAIAQSWWRKYRGLKLEEAASVVQDIDPTSPK